MAFRTLTLLLLSIIQCDYCASDGTPAAVHSIGVGYNILYGNPNGVDMTHGGEDPGLLMTRHILQIESEPGSPSQIIYEHHDTCQSTSSETLIYSPRSYQDYLKEGITFAGTALPSLLASSFSLSSGYMTVKKETNDLRYVLQENSTTCILGTARYPLSLVAGNYYQLADEFVTEVCSLPEMFDSAKYTAFLDTWGTHIVTGMKLGSRQTDTAVSKRLDYIETVLEKSKDDVHVDIGGPMYGYDSSWVVDLDTLKVRPDVSIKVGNSISRFSKGDINSPEPVGLNLLSIDAALSPDFWHDNQYTNTITTCHENFSASVRRQNIIKALQQYASVKGADSPQVDKLAMPVVWPKGHFGFPRTKSGCPNQINEWTGGWLNQTTEVQSPDSVWNATHLDGVLNRRYYYLKFCMKTLADEFAMEWPAGDYCIFKYKTCPRGFVEGYVQWDDDDTANANAHGGVVPDGNYGVDTRMYYCCRSDGDAQNAIPLPTGQPFYLFQYKHGCQEVMGMSHLTQYLLWDDEDGRSTTHAAIGNVHPGMKFCNPPKHLGCGTGSTIYYCYYEKRQQSIIIG